MLFKKYKFSFKKIVVIFSVAAISVFCYGFADEYFAVTKNLDIFTSLFRELNIYYVDSIDPGKLMKKGIDEMLSDLDPYTNFIPESEMDDYRYITTGQYGGIGAVIRQKGDYVVVSDPYQGFPAQKSGLIPGDYILEIDGVSAKGKKTDDVSHVLKGSPGSHVKLLMRRDGVDAPFEKILTREEITVKSVPFYELRDDGIGYIKLNGFTEHASRDVGAAMNEMKVSGKLKGIVFDLRGNPGGLLYEAVNVSNLFITKGQEIVTTRGKIKDNDRIYKSINEPVDNELPVALLVNSGSASASEIVSGSLQDLDRAVIIGQRTFGKGLVQTTRPLSYNTQLKITTAKYYIPSGRCIQALDYSHRNEDGSVGKVPDSLMKAFKTKNGRTVYDGGGILPDIPVADEKLSNISASLLSKNFVFDYANEYFRRHPVVKDENIVLTDSDFSDFKNFLQGKDYGYSTKSEKSLDDLKKNMQDEEYYESLKNDLDNFRTRLSHNKQDDLLKNKDEIISLLEDEIASRYFYQTGRIKKSLSHDPEFDKAVEILKNKEYYSAILSGSANIEKSKSIRR